MSILIKGMEMPKTHPLTVTIYPDGQVLSETVGAKDKHGIAVPVPPHGRLIDADEFLKNAQLQRCFRGDYALLLNDVIEECITVIPAEEGET